MTRLLLCALLASCATTPALVTYPAPGCRLTVSPPVKPKLTPLPCASPCWLSLSEADTKALLAWTLASDEWNTNVWDRCRTVGEH